MKITLLIDGKEKTFIAPFVSTRRLKETLALSKLMERGVNSDSIDTLGEYMVDVYGKQFTIDELLDGFPASEFIDKVVEDMEKVIGSFEKKLKN
ncbi:phage tail assembly chaperone G [Clostridium ihumii]|uniref:phage tail assembly chaperone G n=1 Tax=Clostridium ihumii TaxID=1470356 RepID=UPI003D34DAAB